jgi:hypothetical protein
LRDTDLLVDFDDRMSSPIIDSILFELEGYLLFRFSVRLFKAKGMQRGCVGIV